MFDRYKVEVATLILKKKMESLLLPNEIEMFIDDMIPQTMENVGSQLWLAWHQRLQKLNQQALIEASALKHEYVKESLVTFGKVKILIHEAILINLWKHKVLPHLLKLEPRPESTFIAYSVLYHEGVSVALLELVLYHPDCSESLDDYAADLLDYVYGATSQMLSIVYIDQELNENPQEELCRQQNNLGFDIGIRSLSIIRYLAESLESLPFNIRTRMYATYDIPVLLAHILLVRPWERNGKLYSGGSWKIWDQEQLGQAEAQVWLTLRQLLLDPECMKGYPLTQTRKSQLMQLLSLMKPTLLDQLSSLIELNHWLSRLSMLEQTAAPPKPFLLETMLEIKEQILASCGGKWKNIAKKQLTVIFTNDKHVLTKAAKQLIEAYNTDLLEKIEIKDQAECVQCGKGAIQRCSRCKTSWYCSRSCQVMHWPKHKEECPRVQ